MAFDPENPTSVREMTDGEFVHNPQVLKGLVGLLVLVTLRDGESYGYEITSKLREGGLTGLSEGTVYPVLSRLEKDKFLATRLVASTSGPARKYYALTTSGKAELQKCWSHWQQLVEVVNAFAE